MIEVKNLVKKYGDRVVVDDLSFTLCEGRIHGILGPNGAGKSTVMNMITGCLRPDSGSVIVSGTDVSAHPVEAKRRIGYLPEIPPLYENMTVYELLVFVAEARKVSEDKLERNVNSVMELTHIDDVKDRLIKNLSKGYKQRVGLAQAMLGNPDVIVLDEPTVGLDPQQLTDIRELIKKLGEVKTVIISSHILSEIGELCDDMLIIADGKKIAQGTMEELEQRLNRAQTLVISVRGEEDKVISVLRDIKNISECTVIKNEQGVMSLRLEYDTEKEIRDIVFSAFAVAGYPILSMDTEALTLEDIYMKLTVNAGEKDMPEQKVGLFEERGNRE